MTAARIEPFEVYAGLYEEWFDSNKLVYESELRAVGSLLPSEGNGIEVGVGSGRFAAPLGIKIGVEPSRKMRNIAASRGIAVISGIAESLPLTDACCDYVLMVTTICFLDDIDVSFQEVKRVLRPGGHFVIGFIDKESPIGRLYQRYKDQSPFYRVATFYSIHEVIECLRRTGFVDFHFVQTIFHDISDVNEVELVKEGYGEGSFVVVKAQKGL